MIVSSNIEIAINRIENVRKNSLRYLDLSSLHLTEIPVDISDLTYLLDIDLSYNQFHDFPSVLSQLDNLHYIKINNNNLKDVNFKLGKYYSLKELDISSNLLNHISHELFYLPEDCNINYENNPFLEELPPELEYVENFDEYEFEGDNKKRWEHLSYIYYFQKELRNKDNHKRLFETKLLIVGKGNVGKTTLMKVIKNPYYVVSIGNEKQTHGININERLLPVYLPAKQPFYTNNEADNLYIKVSKNYTEEHDVHNELIEKSHGESYTPIGHFDLDIEYIMNLRLSKQPYKSFNNKIYFKKEIKLNLWDFGGQELLYGTHQFFLTQRSIYIFLWDSRPDNEEESFEYWLNTIQRLSNNSPVIVAMNKMDNAIKNIDEDVYKNRFKNIVGFFRISCVSKEGISDLISQISKSIIDLPHIGDVMPNSWNNIRVKLKSIKSDFISYNEFKKICETSDYEHTRHISSYLHDLGDIVHFKDDFVLKDIVVINPHWLTKAIYELIHSLKVQKNNGLFNASELINILDKEKYPPENHHKVLLLMEKFEICFKVIGSNNLYVIPTLLQATSPKGCTREEFSNPEMIKYEIQYSFLPSGLIERLICRQKDIIRQNHFWKYGAIFKNELGQALVELKKAKKTIQISIIGSLKSTIYTTITEEIKKINKDLKLKPEDFTEKIACNCIECSANDLPFMFEKNVLLKFLNKNKTNIDCQKSAESVEIEKLLLGFKHSSAQHTLIRDFLKASSLLQSQPKLTRNFDENKINTLFQMHLRQSLDKNYFTNEQSLKGKSETGLKQGELDISVETRDGNSISFYEGLVLDSVNKTNINNHIIKSITHYDPNGLKEKYIGVYYKKNSFSSFCKRYFNHLKNNHPNTKNIKNIVLDDITNQYISGSEIKLYKITYERNNVKLYLYHILINLH